MMKRNKRKGSKNLFYLVKRVFPIMWKACPGLFVLSTFFNALRGISIGYLIYLSAELYDGITAFVVKHTDSNVLGIVCFFGFITILGQILNAINIYIVQVIFDLIIMRVTEKIHIKASKIEVIKYENEEVYDELNKALQGAGDCLGLIFIVFTPFTFHLPLFLFMIWYFAKLNPLLIGLLILIFAPVVVSYIFKVKAKAKLEDEISGIRRVLDNLQQCVIGREYFKETRVLGAFDFLYKKYLDKLNELQRHEMVYQRKNTFIDIGSKVLTLIGYGTAILCIVYCVLDGSISIGAFAAIFTGISVLFDEIKGLVCDDIGESIMNLSTVGNLVNFLDSSEDSYTVCDSKQNQTHLLEIEGGFFRYPNSNKWVLKDINLKINEGEKIAIVGENGCGKTTLTKVLLGMYKLEKGNVFFEGVNVAEKNLKERFESKSAVFQNFQRYKLSLKDNICISCMGNGKHQMELNEALEKADYVNRPGCDESTILSAEFGGIDLSGGQWQRVAIARGIYRDCKFIVLDEPTSAIDPVEESRIYENFANVTEGKTAILVTHRLGAAKIADRIIMMKKGEILDFGTHNELMERCNEYYEFYKAQAQMYNGM